jgi:hypothetical protein
MRRITINFPQAAFEQLQKNAIKKEVSLAYYLRELVEIGRQVEEAASLQKEAAEQKNNADFLPESDAHLWKHDLLWTLESRYLLRYLVDNMSDQSAEKREAVLGTAKEKAQVLVEELLSGKPKSV